MNNKVKTFLFAVLGYAFVISQILYAGGRPSKGTPADKRLSRNKPTAPTPPKPAPAPTPKKG